MTYTPVSIARREIARMRIPKTYGDASDKEEGIGVIMLFHTRIARCGDANATYGR